MSNIFDKLFHSKRKFNLEKEQVLEEKRLMTNELKKINDTLENIIKNGKIQSEVVIKNIDQIIKENTK